MKRVLLATVLVVLATANLHAQATPYYQGKQIRVIVGFTSGGFYDRWARLLSRHLPKHIPGPRKENPAQIERQVGGSLVY